MITRTLAAVMLALLSTTASAQNYYARTTLKGVAPKPTAPVVKPVTCAAPTMDRALSSSGNALPSNSVPWDAGGAWVAKAMAICESEKFGGTGGNTCSGYHFPNDPNVTVVRYRSNGAYPVARPGHVDASFTTSCTDN